MNFGAGLKVLLVLALLGAASLACGSLADRPTQERTSGPGVEPASAVTGQAVPTLTVPAPAEAAATTGAPAQQLGQTTPELVELYHRVSPGVVNINVVVNQGGQFGEGAGSGFVLDDQGHVVTNNHVVAGAEAVTVIFFDGSELPAEVVGTDADSDLAVVKVDQLPGGTVPLPLGDSSQVQVGEWVVAIGNPFGLGTSMSIGIVSATGRTIESGATPFDIPEAIQTDAAINPGNSGGPLLSLNGEVIGVNAQIATGGTRASSGVGFAIPANVVRRVAPALISQGDYDWPWLGVDGLPVNSLVAEANNFDGLHGAYILHVIPGGPAEQAGLRGSASTAPVAGVEVPVGGDIVLEADGQPINGFNDLLVIITSHAPGDELPLVVWRDGRQVSLTVRLAARPADLQQPDFQHPD